MTKTARAWQVLRVFAAGAVGALALHEMALALTIASGVAAILGIAGAADLIGAARGKG